MWRFAPDLLRKWKVPKVGEFQKTNLHGGRLWGSYTEWHRKPITARRIALIFEKCALNTNCSDAVLKQTSKTLSYLYLLETGVPKSNWPSLPGLKITLAKRKKIRQQQTVKPLDVPTGHQLAYAFTREWRENNKSCASSVQPSVHGTRMCSEADPKVTSTKSRRAPVTGSVTTAGAQPS